jgi:hypothetical protein
MAGKGAEMVAKRNRIDSAGDSEVGVPPSLRAIDQGEHAEHVSSPARQLQENLASRISDGFATGDYDGVERWPRRQRLIFLIASATALWGATIGLAMIGSAILH